MRPASFTREQDDIILTNRNASEINAEFTLRGLEPRTPEAISKRRLYLKHKGVLPGANGYMDESIDVSVRLPRIVTRIEVLNKEIEALTNRKQALIRERDGLMQAFTQLSAEFTHNVNGD